MTNESGRAERCPSCKGEKRAMMRNLRNEELLECPDKWHDAPPAASTGTPACETCGGSGVVLGPRLLGARECPTCHANAPPEPGSAEQFTINDGVRLIKKLEACEGMEAKLVLLRMFGDKYTASLRAQLQEREREIAEYMQAIKADLDESGAGKDSSSESGT